MGNTIDKVIDGLYVGGFMGRCSCVVWGVYTEAYCHCTGANNKEALREHGITHVLAIHDSAKAEFPEASVARVCVCVWDHFQRDTTLNSYLQDFEYKCIKVADSSSSDL